MFFEAFNNVQSYKNTVRNDPVCHIDGFSPPSHAQTDTRLHIKTSYITSTSRSSFSASAINNLTPSIHTAQHALISLWMVLIRYNNNNNNN